MQQNKHKEKNSEETLQSSSWSGRDIQNRFHVEDKDMEIIDEIRERVEMLRSHGMEEGVISNLFMKEYKLSRLVVTSDYRILLPDYQNMEITMPALYKSVYILFLKHPEGIVFKCLQDYRKELSEIYGRITVFTDSEKIDKSIRDVTNPMSNSINEKCTRIRSAFIHCMDISIARHYFITGKRGERKRINLPPEMIIFE
jgi:hypothetical protein